MLFAISGSQGSGKSTVIATLKARGYPVIERKTSRSIMNEWGVTLSEVNNDRDLTVRFQDEILQRKIDDDAEASKDPSRIYFTERTLADFFAYALIAIGKDNEYSEWVDDYYLRCLKAQEAYNHNFFLNPISTIEHDGVRGSNQYYASMVDAVIRLLQSKMRQDSYISFHDTYAAPTTTIITAQDNEARVDEILRTISKFI